MTEENKQASLLGKIAAYTEILNTDPRSTIFVSLSETYRKMGMLDDARTIAEKGLAGLPDFCPGHIVLGRILCQQGDYAGSSASFSRALELDGTSLAALVGFARLSLQIGQEEQARPLLLKARSLSPADPVINKLINALPPAPVVEEEPVPQVEPAAPLLSGTLAELYLKQGLPEKALDIYRELLDNDPDNLEIRRRIRDLELGPEQGAQPDVVEEPDVAAEPIESAVESSAGEEEIAAQQEGIAQELPQVTAAEEPVQPEEPASEEPVTSADLEGISPQLPAELNPQSEITPPPTALETLNQWLEHIQQRRGDVQANS